MRTERLWGAALWLALLAGCDDDVTLAPLEDHVATTPAASASAASCGGTVLFGRPVARTGLSEDECQPRCTCGGATFEAPVYGQSDIDELLSWSLESPPADLEADPYAAPPRAPSPPEEVCAVLPSPSGGKTYTLASYASLAAARAAGATVTHYGACGLCSSLANLAVYMKFPDLTAPVRDCGIKGLGGDEATQLACLEKLGLEHACAQIWSYNTDHTRAVCFDTCIAALGAPYQNADGSLNACLQCDEDQSGAVFKAVAGRTRRNTGIASALCRPCSEVRPLLHQYSTR